MAHERRWISACGIVEFTPSLLCHHGARVDTHRGWKHSAALSKPLARMYVRLQHALVKQRHAHGLADENVNLSVVSTACTSRCGCLRRSNSGNACTHTCTQQQASHIHTRARARSHACTHAHTFSGSSMSSIFPLTIVMTSSSPLLSTSARAWSAILLASTPYTLRAPARAAKKLRMPVPQPTSHTTFPLN